MTEATMVLMVHLACLPVCTNTQKNHYEGECPGKKGRIPSLFEASPEFCEGQVCGGSKGRSSEAIYPQKNSREKDGVGHSDSCEAAVSGSVGDEEDEERKEEEDYDPGKTYAVLADLEVTVLMMMTSISITMMMMITTTKMTTTMSTTPPDNRPGQRWHAGTRNSHRKVSADSPAIPGSLVVVVVVIVVVAVVVVVHFHFCVDAHDMTMTTTTTTTTLMMIRMTVTMKRMRRRRRRRKSPYRQWCNNPMRLSLSEAVN
ncbi:hypothetical protein PoB_001449800 [Plakobranchus ocellatus]|uniref:Uncharacterized protein n=1 Tax=Plakobranchus ocellatus TaxID=259542 RepID=A0AAV3YZR3_9GAST|nr:hypothetical protein PoB_001449800 [Plakobranchus ocellatus]